MKKNMGIIDRVARIILAIVLGILFFTGIVTGTWGGVILVVAALMLITAVFGICPAYIPFKLNTGAKKV